MEDPDTVTRQHFVQAVAGIMEGATAARLYDLFNQIALLRYEDSESIGTLLLTSPNRSGVELALSLITPLDVSDVRGARKLLRISAMNLSVLCDGSSIYGFGRQLDPANWIPLVEFQRRGLWRLIHRRDDWLQVNVLALPQAQRGLEEGTFKDCLQKVFGAVSPATAQHLWELMLVASHQTYGTNVLITPHAAAETVRLRSQCTTVAPVRLTPQLVERITAIDGTVIIDLNGICHAVGAILDGNVSARGDRTRGGRYNSALMYVDSCPFPSLIVVVSQDGLVDLVYALDRATRE